MTNFFMVFTLPNLEGTVASSSQKVRRKDDSKRLAATAEHCNIRGDSA